MRVKGIFLCCSCSLFSLLCVLLFLLSFDFSCIGLVTVQHFRSVVRHFKNFSEKEIRQWVWLIFSIHLLLHTVILLLRWFDTHLFSWVSPYCASWLSHRQILSHNFHFSLFTGRPVTELVDRRRLNRPDLRIRVGNSMAPWSRHHHGCQGLQRGPFSRLKGVHFSVFYLPFNLVIFLSLFYFLLLELFVWRSSDKGLGVGHQSQSLVLRLAMCFCICLLLLLVEWSSLWVSDVRVPAPRVLDLKRPHPVTIVIDSNQESKRRYILVRQ